MTFKTYLSVFGSDDKKHYLERKFGYKFRALERVYPNADKLPDDEIQKAINVFYDGSPNEDTDVMLNRVKDYTAKNEPIWKEKYFNPKPKPMQTSVSQPQTNNLQYPTSYTNNKKIAPPQPRKPQSNKTNDVDYSKYGEGFSKEFIDKMLADTEYQQILNNYIIPNEGGYSNRNNDRGGITNFGISHNTYPDEDIKNLTRERANAIIYRDFYKWNGLNKLPYKVRGFVVDYGMPTSPLNAIRTTHRVLNLPPNGTIIGNDTLNKFNNFSNIDYEHFLENYKKEMKKYYNNIVEKDKSQYENLNGWLNRANKAHLAK